jgi:hypothetical protein
MCLVWFKEVKYIPSFICVSYSSKLLANFAMRTLIEHSSHPPCLFEGFLYLLAYIAKLLSIQLSNAVKLSLNTTCTYHAVQKCIS